MQKKKIMLGACVLTVSICVVAVVTTVTCAPFSIMKAKGNRYELLKTYWYYQLSKDQEKRKAANFILKNMEGNYCYSSNAADSFMTIVKNCDSIMKESQMNKIWQEISKNERKICLADLCHLNAEMLISDIDCAIETWRNARWKDEVCFEDFCSYILPYRVMNEKPENGWRKDLASKYKCLIDGTDDLKKAFYLVHDSIQRKIRRAAYNYSYQMNSFEMENIQKGSCLQRCIYEVAVMRALGIPAVIDGIDCWANYSRNGHTWVALITRDGTYTVTEGDSIARKDNPIDASIFTLKKQVSDDFPYDTTFQKRCAKISRQHFETFKYKYEDQDVPKEVANRFHDKHVEDVSQEYGFKCSYSLSAADSEYCYLCVYRIGKGWTPVAYTKNDKGRYTFNNIGYDFICLPVIYKDKRQIPLSNPVKITKGGNIVINPSPKKIKEITITRKYPMVNTFYTEWARLEGSMFVGSNSRDFKDSCILFTIDKTPHYINIIKLLSRQKYKYIKFQAPKGIKAPIAEVTFRHNNNIIPAIPFSKDAEELEKCIDGDYFTMPKIKYNAYKIVFEIEDNSKIDEIGLIPKNDGNYVTPGHTYTLLYYDKDWKTVSCKTAVNHSITFHNVPDNSLLLLKDNNGGIEERPFMYINRKQEWW